MNGCLYIVASPIGNLDDLSFRALETIQKVEIIYCEDTRRTKVLLARFNLKKPLASFHQHSESKLDDLVGQLKGGRTIAYLTDAGTPGIQDPGGRLVAAAREAGVKVVPIPGVSALTAVLSVAGIPADKFYFAGFVPTKKGRDTFIKDILKRAEPVVFFETAPRLHRLFDQLIEFNGGKRTLIVGRELTKQFEQIERGAPEQLKKDFPEPKGEFVLVLTSNEKR